MPGPTSHTSDPLGLEPEEMRRLGHWVVDRVIDHFENGPDGPAIQVSSPHVLLDKLGGKPPEEPGEAIRAVETLVNVAVANMQHGDHPRYFARVPSPSSFAGVVGDWLGTGFNAITSSWAGASGPATVELVVLDWLRSQLGLPSGTEGVLTSGGSLANLMGLVVARHAEGPGVAYLSDQTHASIKRGLIATGFPPDHVEVLPSDSDFCLSAETVAAVVAEDRRRGRRPKFIVATAGTVNTGAVDELGPLADLCAAEDLWLHVDGAYGASAALCEAGRSAMVGLDRADSVVIDPHKWLFQPYDVGCLLVRRPGSLENAFDVAPEYLADTTADPGEVDFRDRSLELTRRFRASKLWLAFHVYGMRRIREAIEHGIALAEHAERTLHDDDRWRIVTPARLGIVTFERPGAAEDEHAARAAALAREGYAVVTSTAVRNRSVLRLCTINPRTTEQDIDSTIDRLARLSV